MYMYTPSLEVICLPCLQTLHFMKYWSKCLNDNYNYPESAAANVSKIEFLCEQCHTNALKLTKLFGRLQAVCRDITEDFRHERNTVS